MRPLHYAEVVRNRKGFVTEVTGLDEPIKTREYGFMRGSMNPQGAPLFAAGRLFVAEDPRGVPRIHDCRRPSRPGFRHSSRNLQEGLSMQGRIFFRRSGQLRPHHLRAMDGSRRNRQHGGSRVLTRGREGFVPDPGHRRAGPIPKSRFRRLRDASDVHALVVTDPGKFVTDFRRGFSIG